jgi:hypothetical protein
MIIVYLIPIFLISIIVVCLFLEFSIPFSPQLLVSEVPIFVTFLLKFSWLVYSGCSHLEHRTSMKHFRFTSVS